MDSPMARFRNHPNARLVLSDDSVSMALSEDFVKITLLRGLWPGINQVFGFLVDEYEEEEIPISKTAIVAAEIRRWLEAVSGCSPDLAREILQAADFFDAAADAKKSVWVCL